MQLGFYFDQTRCIACFTCVVACKDWNGIDAGPASWRRVMTIEKGEYPNLSVTFLSTACNHCMKPSCLSACPVDAISKRELDGVVVVAQETCLGKDNCDMCLKSCLYAAPQFGAEANAKMQKCNFCLDRLAGGKKPICVDACPMRAIDAGPIEELIEKYGNIREAEGFVYSEKLDPSIIFKPKQDREDLVIQRTQIAPHPLAPLD